MTELQHHGIKGQKWGVRRYQNSDGSYTAAGKKRYYGKTSQNEGQNEESFDSKGNRSTVRKILTSTAYDSSAKWKSVFEDKALQKDKEDLVNLRDGVKKARSEIIGTAYDKAYKEYEDEHRQAFERNKDRWGYDSFEDYKNDNDLEYGFDHYMWNSGDYYESDSKYSKMYNDAYSKFNNSEAKKAYDQKCIDVGKKITDGYGDKPVHKDDESYTYFDAVVNDVNRYMNYFVSKE